MNARLSSILHARLIAHTAAAPSEEVCGLLFGDSHQAGIVIDLVRPATNVSPNPADSFELDPAALFAALRAERAGGPRLLGHYHSHPSGRAVPSPRDAAAARDHGRLWLIIAGGAVRLWRAEAGGPVLDAFRPVTLAIVPQP